MSDILKKELRFTVAPFVDFAAEEFGCYTTDIAGEIHRKVARAEDEAIRQSLQALGWAPPEEYAKLMQEASAMRDAIKEARDALDDMRWSARPSRIENPRMFVAWEKASTALIKLQPFLKT